jgi:phytanoyl-CoA hydroxylase
VESQENLNEYLTEYKEKGFTKIEGFFSTDELSNLESELQKFIDEHTENMVRDEINYTSSGQINSIHRLAGIKSGIESYFSNLLNKSKFRELAAVFLEDEAEVRNMEFFAKPAREGLKSPWHQDNFYWGVAGGNALTIWLSLDHCDETNGAVKYVVGSHKLGTIDHKDSFAPGSSQTVADESLMADKDKVVCLSLKPGDILIHHSDTIHGSDDNKSDRSRRGITFQYKGKNSEYDQEMINHYLSRLEKQVNMRQKDS